MPDASVINSILAPRAVAFIGASTVPSKWGFNILHNKGDMGKAWPIDSHRGPFHRQVVLEDLKGGALGAMAWQSQV